MKRHLGTTGPETADVETLRLEVTELRQKYEALLEENKELKAKVIAFRFYLKSFEIIQCDETRIYSLALLQFLDKVQLFLSLLDWY